MPQLIKARQSARLRYRPVNQYDLEGNLLHTFGSIKEASVAVGRKASSIFKAVSGKRKTSAGYV